MKRTRIGNIELRCRNKTWEIVRWYPNSYYQRENEFIKVDDEHYQYKDNDNCYVHKSCFANPESCYVIAFIEGSEDEHDIRSVGMRPWMLDEEDEKDFKQLLKINFDYEEE